MTLLLVRNLLILIHFIFAFGEMRKISYMNLRIVANFPHILFF
jgi:hypothetical protein